ncbi:cyclic nucleotide-gated channel rod photoreceptor subunit alpha-like [Tubulanus polymorphus]|uniref:cyclic nucleotide-gated channel rod photoreceptor subunit alpha-like n=1 Tax=Tubulanus polymorphus TaxID=672921 RepID=UPI003DA23F8C
MDKTTKDISTEAIKQIEEIESDDDDDILNRSRQEEDFEIESSEFVFDPDGNISYYWMGLVTLTVMYNCWMIILRIAFPEMREDLVNQRMFNFFDLVCDLFYLADVFVQLRTAYLENGILVLDPVKLSRNYRRKPEFIQDMIAIAPVGTLATFVARFTDTAIMDIGDIDGSDVYIPIVRIPRLLKVSTVGRFFDISDSRTSNPNIIRAMKLSMYLTLVIHWIACFYYMVSLYEGLGSNDWVYPNKTEDLVFRSTYIRTLYWATMTLTTIGGTNVPVTTIEYIFTGVTFLIGVFVFAAVVGNVGDVISNMNAARQEFQSRMDQIKFYMNHRRVPEVLQNRVKRWADYSWSRTQAMDEISMLEMLPERIRTEIAIHVHLETLKKVKIFEECEIGLLHELVLKLRAQIYSPGDYICRTGEIGREMYIINHGKVEILVNNSTAPGGKMVVASLSEGNYFGEISLLKLDSGQNKRTADVRSVGYSELLVLSRRDLMSALVEYPDAKQILEAQARERMEKNREVRRTSTVESSDSQGATVPSANTEPPSSNKKKDQLMQLIKSNDFQRLVKGGKVDVGKEMSELRHVIRELRSFDSQSTKYRIQQLAEKCDGLQEKLRKRDVELRHAIRRVNELELILASPEERVKLQSRKKCNGISLRHRKHKEPNSSDSFLPADTNGASHSRKMRRQQRSESTESSNSHNSPRDKIHSLSHVVVPGISINGVVEQEVSNLIIEKDDDDDDLEIDDELDNREENEKVVPNILADLERLANDVNLYSDTSKYSDDFSSTENSSDDDDTDDR